MSWIQDSIQHRCPLPNIPKTYGPGSLWRCDETLDSCGQIWRLVDRDRDGTPEWATEDYNLDMAVTAPSTVAERVQLEPAPSGKGNAKTPLSLGGAEGLDFAGGGVVLG